MTIFLIGMCYAGKTTIGRLLSEKLNKRGIDSRDIFMSKFNMSENEYLTKYGKTKFQEAEELSISQDFGDSIISLGGSAIYYNKQMKYILDNHIVVWLDAPFDVILKRKSNENWERPIVFPNGINTFEELYYQRKELYKNFHTIRIPIKETDSPDDVVDNIILRLKL
jgi:shikimate kinase